jgi:hypothetical protein
MTNVWTERDRQLQELLDKQAIREAIMRFCRGVDRCDADLINSAFHSDAIDPQHGGHGTYTGENMAEKLIAWVKKAEKAPIHMVTSQLIEIDGDIAASEAYFFTSHIERVGEEDLVLQSIGRYLDRFERRDGEWKIAHRTILSEIVNYFRSAGRPERSRTGLGRSDPSDPSYALFANVHAG